MCAKEIIESRVGAPAKKDVICVAGVGREAVEVRHGGFPLHF